ncbi:hypothetical protein HPB51_027933 [Rhipicephalus microplus]|uniref:Uncharacterized protein n=1 Tax=Rhipicephalus microplus TaxID=6941 RepID=A0A9J6CYR2_RHIMP|nr:hypothetical protein HPB51_027933 [Rhipicephalus microplus]
MSDLSNSTSNYSSFLLSSSKHLVMGVSEEDMLQTVNRSSCTSPLSSVGLDEYNSDDTSEPRTATHQLEQPSSNDELNSRKRSMTLDLYSPGAFRNGHKEAHCSSLLPSPVLQMLVVSTPELEQFITFNGRNPVVNRLFALTETEEEERYPIDFFESLEQLQRQPLQPALQQHATSGSDMFDSTSNDRSFLSSSSEHMVMGVFDNYKPQTLHHLDCTPPLSCIGLDEKNSGDTNEQPTAVHRPAHQPVQQQQTSSNEELSSRKRSMTLDLYSPGAFRHGHKEAHCSSLLPSPVLQMLVLSTPELEQFITLNGRDLMENELFALNETKEEERYPRDFLESLDQLQRQPQQPALQQHATSGPDTSGSCDWISSDSLTRPLTSEAQAAPTDMRGTQDMRLEQRRERNSGINVPPAISRPHLGARRKS